MLLKRKIKWAVNQADTASRSGLGSEHFFFADFTDKKGFS